MPLDLWKTGDKKGAKHALVGFGNGWVTGGKEWDPLKWKLYLETFLAGVYSQDRTVGT